MSAAEANPAVVKKFGKGERSVPHHSQKAKKFYSAYDEKHPKKVRIFRGLNAHMSRMKSWLRLDMTVR